MQERMKVLLIVNPAAGQLKAKTGLMDIVKRMNALGCLVTVVTTQRRAQASELVKELRGDYDRLVCCGGDGTLNEVISGLMQTEGKKELGYIPAGTTNDFAAGLGLAKDLGKAAEAAVCGLPHELDLGSFNGRYFSYVASFGMFSASSYSAPQAVKNIFGHAAYVMEGMKELLNIKTYPVRVEADGQTIEGEYIYGSISNATSIGGIVKLDPKLVDLRDGKFEVVLIKPLKSADSLTRLAMSLTSKHYDPEVMDFFQASEIRMTLPEQQPWSLDGEYEEGVKEADIRSLPHAIRMIY